MTKDMGRFLNKIDITDTNDCIVWSASKFKGGYGQFKARCGDRLKNYLSHRWIWEQTNGTIPEGMKLDHICKNRACVNTFHLRVVTQRQNVLENSDSLQAINHIKTHCDKGHEFTLENTHYFRNGTSRYCRTCKRDSSRISMRKYRSDNMLVSA
jgi:hypothetical protein